MIPINIFRHRAAFIAVFTASALFLGGGAKLGVAARVPEASSGATQPKDRLAPCSPNLVVTTNADSGPGSLRQAIADACSGGTITFNMNRVVSPIILTSGALGANQDLTINGPGAGQLTVSGNDHVAVFQATVASPGVVTLSGLSLTHGASSTGGAGIFHNGSGTLNITNCIVSNNMTFMRGGGVSNGGAGIVNVNNSTLNSNHAFGGGCGVLNSSIGTVNITNSTLSSNSAFSLGSRGGGILNSSTGMVNVTNSTLSNNNAATGAGILNDSTGTVNITNSTISYNFAMSISILGHHPLLRPSLEPPTFGGGNFNSSTGPFRIRNSITALNFASAGGADLDGAFITQGHNLIGRNDGSTGFTPGTGNPNGDLVGTGTSPIDPRLGPLADNGGPTQTHMLLGNSPARDAGDNSGITNPPFAGPPFTDQRGPGFPRILNTTVDIGSVEATPRPATLGNISTRLQVGTADGVMIAGFIVQGSSPKRVLIRAAGPSLTQFGVPNVLANPRLELHDTSNAIGMNDDWRTTQIGGLITSDQVAEIQNSGLAPRDPLESAMIATLAPGSYTAIVQGVNGGTGVGLVEAYDLGTNSGSLLANISTRGFVQNEDNLMIGGFIVVTQATRVIIRAIGPSLTQFGVADALANPQLELHDATSLIGRNDDWQTTQLGGIITSVQAGEIQNSQFAPTNAAESAIIATLQPGSYTAIVRGVNNTTGNALVEVYPLQ